MKCHLTLAHFIMKETGVLAPDNMLERMEEKKRGSEREAEKFNYRGIAKEEPENKALKKHDESKRQIQLGM